MLSGFLKNSPQTLLSSHPASAENLLILSSKPGTTFVSNLSSLFFSLDLVKVIIICGSVIRYV